MPALCRHPRGREYLGQFTCRPVDAGTSPA